MGRYPLDEPKQLAIWSAHQHGGLTQQGLAIQFGVSQSTVHNVLERMRRRSWTPTDEGHGLQLELQELLSFAIRYVEHYQRLLPRVLAWLARVNVHLDPVLAKRISSHQTGIHLPAKREEQITAAQLERGRKDDILASLNAIEDELKDEEGTPPAGV